MDTKSSLEMQVSSTVTQKLVVICFQFWNETSWWLERNQFEVYDRCRAWFWNNCSSWKAGDQKAILMGKWSLVWPVRPIKMIKILQKRWSVPTLVTLIFVITKTVVHPDSCWLYIGSNTVWIWFAPEIMITSFLLTQDCSIFIRIFQKSVSAPTSVITHEP